MKTTKYRKIPEEIEAVKWSAMEDWEFALGLADWCGGEAIRDKNPMDTEKTYYWQILRPGDQKQKSFVAFPGDYIVKYPNGTFMVADSRVFEKDYEVV